MEREWGAKQGPEPGRCVTPPEQGCNGLASSQQRCDRGAMRQKVAHGCLLPRGKATVEANMLCLLFQRVLVSYLQRSNRN